MSKKAAEETSSVPDQTMPEGCQKSLNMSLDRISENHKKLMEATSNFYATYFSITSEIMRKGFDGHMARSYYPLNNEYSRKYEEDVTKKYKDAQEVLENSMRLNDKLILDTIQLAVETNRLYFSTLMSNFPTYPQTFFKGWEFYPTRPR